VVQINFFFDCKKGELRTGKKRVLKAHRGREKRKTQYLAKRRGRGSFVRRGGPTHIADGRGRGCECLRQSVCKKGLEEMTPGPSIGHRTKRLAEKCGSFKRVEWGRGRKAGLSSVGEGMGQPRFGIGKEK